MKGCLLGRSLFYYLVSIDDYYVAVWGASSTKDEVPRLVQQMLYGRAVCFAFKSLDRQSAIDFMVSEDKRLIAEYRLSGRGTYGQQKYRGFPGRKCFFDLQSSQSQEAECL